MFVYVYHDQGNHFKNVLFSGITEVLVFFRLMNFLDVISVLGPLQLAVRRMLIDVAKLMVMLMLILIGFVCSLYSVVTCYKNLWVVDSKEYADFSTFTKTLISMTWSIFEILGHDVSTHIYVNMSLANYCTVIMISNLNFNSDILHLLLLYFTT